MAGGICPMANYNFEMRCGLLAVAEPLIIGGFMNYENGNIYVISHTRKGTFGMRVDSQDEEWLHGEVVGGTAKAIMNYNVKGKGEAITVRKCLIKTAEAV